MNDLKPRIYPDQLDKLISTFIEDEHLSIYDWTNTDGLKKLSADQYWFLIRLWRENHYIKLKLTLDKYLNHK